MRNLQQALNVHQDHMAAVYANPLHFDAFLTSCFPTCISFCTEAEESNERTRDPFCCFLFYLCLLFSRLFFSICVNLVICGSLCHCSFFLFYLSLPFLRFLSFSASFCFHILISLLYGTFCLFILMSSFLMSLCHCRQSSHLFCSFSLLLISCLALGCVYHTVPLAVNL